MTCVYESDSLYEDGFTIRNSGRHDLWPAAGPSVPSPALSETPEPAPEPAEVPEPEPVAPAVPTAPAVPAPDRGDA